MPNFTEFNFNFKLRKTTYFPGDTQPKNQQIIQDMLEIGLGGLEDPSYHQKLEELINKSELAQLEALEVPDTELNSIADLCLRFSESRPQAIGSLLWAHQKLRTETLTLLDANPNILESAQLSLAQCFLNAGFPIQDRSGLSKGVTDFLEKRKKQTDTYWGNKKYKHHRDSAYSRKTFGEGPDAFKIGYPFFSNKQKYSLDNFNCKLVPPGSKEPMVCRHLEQAAQKDTKDFLINIKNKNVNKFTYDNLEKLSKRSEFTSIIFSPGNFGKLMNRLAQRLEPGKEQSFSVTFHTRGGSHAMRVFLKHLVDGRIYLGLYEPNVSANVSHLKVFPEQIVDLDFDKFDFHGMRICNGAGVLSLFVPKEDKDWARTCVGHFVDPDLPNQVFCLSEALTTNNILEVQRVMVILGLKKPKFGKKGLEILGFGLYMALQNAHHSAVKDFLSGLKDLGLSQEQIAEIVSAKRREGTPGLYMALQNGHHSAVKEFLSGLKDLGLSQEQIAEIVSAKTRKGTPGLYWALKRRDYDTVKNYLDGIRDLVNNKVISFDRARLLLIEDHRGRTNIRAMVKSRNNVVVQALAKLVGEMSTHAKWQQAEELLGDLHSVKGAERWYRLRNWKNFGSYDYLLRNIGMKDALTEFQKAEKCLKDKISQTKPKP
jgi:DNA-binding transcriptional MerR regulator